ncbi:MAG: hypothetical protein J5691_00560 [Bacilli bacterium]|nr:hypothetical protein [Bacilli bacterium]
MATPANMYAATHCMVPIFKHEDQRWHVTYMVNGRAIDKKFKDPEKAQAFYIDIFHKLENEYIAKESQDKGSR